MYGFTDSPRKEASGSLVCLCQHVEYSCARMTCQLHPFSVFQFISFHIPAFSRHLLCMHRHQPVFPKPICSDPASLCLSFSLSLSILHAFRSISGGIDLFGIRRAGHSVTGPGRGLRLKRGVKSPHLFWSVPVCWADESRESSEMFPVANKHPRFLKMFSCNSSHCFH